MKFEPNRLVFNLKRFHCTQTRRIAWSILIGVASCIAGILLWYSLYLSMDTPIITTVESTHFPISDVAFPAVTICNFNKISKKAARIEAAKLSSPPGMKLSQEGMARKLRYFTTLFRLNNGGYEQEVKELHEILKYNNVTIKDVLTNLPQKCEDMIEKCFWRGIPVRCDSLVQPIWTMNGHCCAFNYYAQREVFGKYVGSDFFKKARKSVSSGHNGGLTVLLNPDIEDYYSSTFGSYGFEVMIHDPFDYADWNAETKYIEANGEAFLSVIPETTYSEVDVHNSDITTRLCYGVDEIQLFVMNKYSHNNCMAECRRLIAIQLCKCVPFNYARNNTFPTCDMLQMGCIFNYSYILHDVDPEIKGIGLDDFPPSGYKSDNNSCSCLPECTYSEYYTELIVGKLDLDKAVGEQKLFRGLTGKNHTLLHVYYTDLVSSRFRRNLFQNISDVLAMFGGLTGLFVGLSFISIYEFFYIFIFKPYFNRLAIRSLNRRQSVF